MIITGVKQPIGWYPRAQNRDDQNRARIKIAPTITAKVILQKYMYVQAWNGFHCRLTTI